MHMCRSANLCGWAMPGARARARASAASTDQERAVQLLCASRRRLSTGQAAGETRGVSEVRRGGRRLQFGLLAATLPPALSPKGESHLRWCAHDRVVMRAQLMLES